MTVVRQRLSRSLVIELAAVIADREGIDAVTLQRIANDTGVKQPALYRHFSGIEDLWKELALLARRQLARSLAAAQSGHVRRQAVMAVALAWRDFVHTHPGIYTSTDRVASVGDPDIEESLSTVVNTLDSSLTGYPLSTVQRSQCARSLRSALHGFCVLEKDNGHPEPYALDEGLENLVNLFCLGVEALSV